MSTRQLPLFSTGLNYRSRLVDAVEPFQKYLRAEGKAENTVKSFSSDLHLICQYFGDERQLGSLMYSDLNRFLDWLEHGRGKPCSQKSYARRVTTLKVFFKWLMEQHIRQDNPAEAILQRSGPAPLQPILGYEEVHRLTETAHLIALQPKKPDSRPEVLVRLLLETGIKKSEMMNLTVASLDRRLPEHPILNVKYKGQKGVYKERRIAVSNALVSAWDRYVDDPHHKVRDHLFTCTPRNLEYVLSDTASVAGVEGKVSFEILRWTCAVRDYLSGMDLDDIRKKLGLSEISFRETSQKIAQLAKSYR
ncbi:MAG: site-specific integrase [Anaerolineae bacterium]|nr:site-specific integrase [Anaerolineae bacterium]